MYVSSGSISCIYSVSLVVQASEGGHIEALSAFPGMEPYKMTEEALKMCTDLGVTFPGMYLAVSSLVMYTSVSRRAPYVLHNVHCSSVHSTYYTKPIWTTGPKGL